MANIVCTGAPYIILLGDSNLTLMYAIFAIAGLIGAVATSFIPETFKEPLPECIPDVENRKHGSFFSFKTWDDDKKKVDPI